MKNKDEKNTVIACAVLGTVSAASCAFIKPVCGIICAVLCAVLTVIFCRYNRKRYDEIEKLNNYLSAVCTGDYSLDISENTEGELSILKNNLYKVVVLLRTSNEALKNDKIYLADSLADISHQLKTPLTSMMVMTDIMKEECDRSRQEKFIEIMASQLDKMKWLITTLLKISKLDAGTAEFSEAPVSIKEVITDSLKPFSVTLDIKNISVEREDKDFIFKGDKGWCVEAISNIIKNCIEHTPDGGRLSFEADETNIYRELIIKDNGCGIAPEDLPHIFERFYHGKNSSSESVGIGLALANEIMKKHRAKIEASSIIGEGTKFRIIFYKSVV